MRSVTHSVVRERRPHGGGTAGATPRPARTASRPIGVSEAGRATATQVMRAPAGWDPPPHPAPSLRWVITLRGTVEVRTIDGAARPFGPAAAIHLEDTTGVGRATRGLPEEDRLAFVRVRLLARDALAVRERASHRLLAHRKTRR